MTNRQAAVAHRWWVYQRERFPVLAHGVLIAVFSGSAVSYSAHVRAASMPPPRAWVVAFASAFLFFLQLRVLDEFKDFEEDARYRPYRAVPRGVVSLRELGWLGAAAAGIQLVMAVWLHPLLPVLLAGVWLYVALMRVEFFAHAWLTARPFAYMMSHMVVVPLIAFYVTACDWLTEAASGPGGVGWFLLASFFNGLAIEIGRKVRAPGDEEPGVPTYTRAWGVRGAVLAWSAALAATTACVFVAAIRVDALRPAAAVLVPSLGVAAAQAWQFIRRPSARGGRRIEHASGLWALLVYLVLGAAPLVGQA